MTALPLLVCFVTLVYVCCCLGCRWKCWLSIAVMALNSLGEALSPHGWAYAFSDSAGFLGLQVEALHLLVGISQVETLSLFDCSRLVDGSWCRCVGPATVCLY